MVVYRAVLATAVVVAASGVFAASAPETNWPQFRGPGARGIAADAALPERWSSTGHFAWKADVPGRGWSSPIVWGNRVVVTTVVSSGETEAPKKGLYMGGERSTAPAAEHQWKVLCLDLFTGKQLWDRTVHQGQPAGPTHLKNSYASETPVTDGERIYACFGNVGIFCFDFEGRLLWSHPIAAHATRNGWGTAASPVLHRDRLYYVDDNEEDSYLLALDSRTGKEVWRAERDEKSNWATPYVWENSQRTEVITPGTGQTRSYGLDGKLLWSFTGMSRITIATPYAGDDLLYVSSGFVADKQRPLYAIRPGGAGDITLPPGQTGNAAIAWCNPTAAPYNPSTLLYEGRVYVLRDRGMLSAYDAQTGAPLYQNERLPAGAGFTASPWAYNGRVFCLNEDGTTFVVRAGDTFELLATNKLPADEIYLASPAIAAHRLLVRCATRLYCLGNEASAEAAPEQQVTRGSLP